MAKFKGKAQKGSAFPKSKRTNNNKVSKLAKDVDTVFTHKTNDVSWYNHNPELTKASANISWYPTNGTPFFGSDGTPEEMPYYGSSVPGIMVLGFHPSYGVSTEPDSPLNFAATQLYTKCRAANSGRVNYDHTSFFMYTVAVDSLIMFWNHCQRAMQLINCYSVENRYVPKILIESLGFDYEDLMSNQANFKLWMDTYAKQISTFILPKSCDLYVRHAWMCSNVYRDQDSVRSQLYAFRPYGYYVFDQISDPGRTMLAYKKIGNDDYKTVKLTTGNMRSILTTMVNNLIRSTDVNIMIGDIMKAWGNDVMSISGYNDIQLNPVYDREVLLQIHNADIHYQNWRNLDITEDMTEDLDPFIIVDPIADAKGWDSHVWLDTTGNETGPEDVLIMTRLKNQASEKTFVPESSSKAHDEHYECKFRMTGTELIEDVFIYFTMVNPDTKAIDVMNYDLPRIIIPYDYAAPSTMQSHSVGYLGKLHTQIAFYMTFNNAPLWPEFSMSPIQDHTFLAVMRGCLDTITTIDENVLFNVHYTALISLLGL